MDMFLGMGVMLLLIPFNKIFIKLSKQNIYQSLGMVLVMMVMNLVLLTLYTLGLYTEVQSVIKFVIGLVIGVMGNLTYKINLIQTQKGLLNETTIR